MDGSPSFDGEVAPHLWSGPEADLIHTATSGLEPIVGVLCGRQQQDSAYISSSSTSNFCVLHCASEMHGMTGVGWHDMAGQQWKPNEERKQMIARAERHFIPRRSASSGIWLLADSQGAVCVQGKEPPNFQHGWTCP